MHASGFFMPTLREVPAEAEVVSHQLLLRAGFIRKSAAGIYTFLPLALRVLKKIERIVREEMDRAGGLEIQLPILQTADLWHRSGRWNVYGPELMRLKDRHGRDFCLGPTHEEIVTELVKGEVRSYKQLPLLLYQIQNKYRDEKRPRFGLLRGREFIMKDLYSFDRDEAGLEESYRKMYEAYTRVFTRCGLQFRVVEADPGAIGGNVSHEFMALAAAGEATVIYCPACGYAANAEKAESRSPEEPREEQPKQLELVQTPGKRTVEEVTAFLGMPAQKIIKTLVYETEKGLVAALVRGDREVNEVKLQQVVDTLRLELADGSTVEEVTGAPVGFAGPVGLSLPLVIDREVAALANAVAGANVADAHYVNVNPGRDFPLATVADIRLAAAGDRCTRCGEPLAAARGIEVGQLFKLGDKYSRVMGATFLDENGQERPFIMGCYGIGVSRTMAAAVEQHHDEDGIVWPRAIAPFDVVVLPVNNKDTVQMELAEKIYRMLVTAGYDTILDDRTERPGVKFKDADLIGYPVRVTVGQKARANQVEVRLRRTGETVVVDADGVCATVAGLLRVHGSEILNLSV